MQRACCTSIYTCIQRLCGKVMPWRLLVRADFCAFIILGVHSGPLLTGISLWDVCEYIGWKTNWTPYAHSPLYKPDLESFTSPSDSCFLFLRWLWRNETHHRTCLEVEHGTLVSFIMRWKFVLYPMLPPWYIAVPQAKSNEINVLWMDHQKWQAKEDLSIKKVDYRRYVL